MKLGLLLPLGESLADMAAHGQDVRFVKYYLEQYSKQFDEVYLFTYHREGYAGLPKNCKLITPPVGMHRYVYGFLMPVICRKYFDQIDVFRCFHPSAAVPAVFAKMLYGKKFIFNYNYDYSVWARIEDKAFMVPAIKLLEFIAFKLCDLVFVADEKMVAYAKNFVSEETIVLVRNGVDTRAFSPAGRKNARKTRTILSVGRLETQKNYLQLIDAIALVKKRNLKLQIVGKGSLEKILRDRAETKGVHLEIIDVVPHDRLPEIYRAAEVYLQPSLIEAPVKTLIEAMSCGLPCVATDVPGINSVIQDGANGLLAKLTARDISLKISQLLNDSTLSKKIGMAARETAIKKYDLSNFLKVEIKYLKSV